MSIRIKIVLIVLPLILTTLLLAGTSSYFSATTGITRVAQEFLGFKASELEKYAESQWILLVENNFTERVEYVEATKSAVEDYARSVIRSDTELIVAFTNTGDLAMATDTIELADDEKAELLKLVAEDKAGLVTLQLNAQERVANGF